MEHCIYTQTKLEHYQFVRKWKSKLSNLFEDFTPCVIFLFVRKSQISNILASKLVNRLVITQQHGLKGLQYY